MGCNCEGNGNGRAGGGHGGGMNGQAIELFGRQEFSFDDVDTNKSLEYKMVKALDVVDFSAAMLVVRVHSVTIANSAKIEVYIQSTAPSCEEPNTEFVGADILATVEVDASSSAGSSITATVDGAYGAALRVCVKGTQDPSTQGNCKATLSAALVARRAGSGASSWASTLVRGATSGGTAALFTEGDHLGWQDNQGTPVTRWAARNAPADDDWELARLDSGGSETDIPISVTADNGDVFLANRLGVGGDNFDEANISADDLVIGSLSTPSTGLSVLTTQWGELLFTNVGSGTRKVSLWANCSSPYLSFFVGADKFRMEGDAFHGVSDGARALGTSSIRWGDSYFGSRITVGAGDFSDAHTDNDDVVIGDTSASDAGATIVTSTTGIGALAFADSAGNSRGGVFYVHNGDVLRLKAYGSFQAEAAPSQFRPASDDSISLGGAGRRWTNGHFSDDVIQYTTGSGLKAADQSSGDGIHLFITGSQGQSDAGDSGNIAFDIPAGQAATTSNTAGGDGGDIYSEGNATGGAGNGTGAGGAGGAITWAASNGGVGGATGTGGAGGAVAVTAGNGNAGGATSGNGGAGGAASYIAGDGGNATTNGGGGVGGSALLASGDGGDGAGGGEGANAGDLTLRTGSGGSGGDGGSNGNILFQIGGATTRWRIDSVGSRPFRPENDNSEDIGTSAKRVKEVHAIEYLGGVRLTFSPKQAEFPSSNFATLDERNNHPILDFDPDTDESVYFTDVIPGYNGGNIEVRLWWTSTATTGDVRWDVAWERTQGQDIDSDGFATAQSATDTTSGTSGTPSIATITFTSAQIDGVGLYDLFRLKVTRDANNAADTMSADAELLYVQIKEIA